MTMCHRAFVISAAVMASTLLGTALAGGFQSGEFITYSQDSWGAYPPPGSASQLLIDWFHPVYGGGIEVGVPGNAGNSMIFTSVASVLNYLPSSGGPAPLSADHIDPTSTSSGLFGGFVLACQFNVDFNDAGHLTGTSGVRLGDLVLHDLADTPLYNGLPVRQFLAQVNGVLGGGPPPYTYDDIAILTQDLTLAFQGGTPSAFAQQHLRLPCPADVAQPHNGVVDVNDLLLVITHWGACPQLCPPQCVGDIVSNCAVDVNDLLAVITQWGPCQ